MGTSTLPLLGALPQLQPRREQVDVPELNGSVLVRGLTGSELFAVLAFRQQGLQVLEEAKAEWRERCKALPEGAPRPEFQPPELGFDDLKQYGRYVSHLLACAVVTDNDLAMATADQWEVWTQHHPAVVSRLQAVAERLSGMNPEDVRKN